MKKQSILSVAMALFATFALVSCSDDEIDNPVTPEQLRAEILAQTATNVCEAAYIDMHSKTEQLLEAVITLNGSTTDENLAASQQLWKDIRATWEQTEAWLFGPISSDNIDPRIDTWPVDFNALEDILAGTEPLTEEYVDGLGDALKGFHPIEYLLWGQNGDKAAADFTDREKEYLLALATNLNTLSEEVKDSWVNDYTHQLATAGDGSTAYTSQIAAFTELVGAMAGICDEVANGKMKDPFDQQDPSKEESPFAKNSITDFTNNIKGVMDVYQGKFTTDGKGIEDLVRKYNLSLDQEIKTAHATALASLKAIDVPFGEAIISQQTKVQNAMEKINALKDVLETKLVPFVQQYGK